jgi:CubicO group peptidase (beta-lactamase class C family)
LPEPRFTDPQRVAKLATAFPKIDPFYSGIAGPGKLPSVAFGVVIDGELAYGKGFGYRDVASKMPADVDTVYRIASLTKGFTAIAILRLRDESKLSLEDPIAKYVPELAAQNYPTRDTGALTIREALTHSTGLPEDNRWGDRQLAMTDQSMQALLRGGLSFSTAANSRFEYSNLAFAILGRVVARVSGKSYRDYVTETILRPLGMTATTWEAASVPAEHLATGYGDDDAWTVQPQLGDGAFDSVGGLYSSVRDMARYAALLLGASPARDAPESPVLRRSSLREMQQLARARPFDAYRGGDGRLGVQVSGYGFGLDVAEDCEFDHIVMHTGGLPGFGAILLALPEYGVALVAMSNSTYNAPVPQTSAALDALEATGALRPRELPPSGALDRARTAVTRMMDRWDNADVASFTADNFLLDSPASARQAEIHKLNVAHGACRPDGELRAETWLSGSWDLACDRGRVSIHVRLTPANPPKVAELRITDILPPDAKMDAAISRVAALLGQWDAVKAAALFGPNVDKASFQAQVAAFVARHGACAVAEPVGGNGTTRARLKLTCEHGNGELVVTRDEKTDKVVRARITGPADAKCPE